MLTFEESFPEVTPKPVVKTSSGTVYARSRFHFILYLLSKTGCIAAFTPIENAAGPDRIKKNLSGFRWTKIAQQWCW
jgi:hypothetical protein